jgi:allophanate hydrolase subunit 2
VKSNLAYLALGSARLAGRLKELPGIGSVLRYLPIGGGIGQANLAVDPNSSRAGVRLNGLAAQDVPELESEPSCVGAIQRTASGQLIVIGPDGPTIGGYPKVGTVIEADLAQVARQLPGRHVELAPVDWETAQRAAAEGIKRLEKALEALRSGFV